MSRRTRLPETRTILIALAVIALCSTSCQKSLPDGLVVLPGASTPKSYSLKDMVRVEYQVQEKYPATKAIGEVSKQMKQKGWKPLTHFFVYPQSETSEITGWIYYRDPPKAPAWMVYAWSGDWEDANHNIVSYTFRYSDAIGKYNQSVFVLKPDNTNLIITGIYMSAEAAQKLRAEKQKKKSN